MIEHNTSQYRLVSAMLALGSFIVFCNLYLLQPVLPALAQFYQVSDVQVNWVFAATSTMLSVSLVPWAMCSEKYGRRTVMLIGLAITPLTSLLLLFSQTLHVLIFVRVLVGISLAAFAGVAVAYMAEELSPNAFRSAIGVYIAANSLGGITGRLYGGLITDWFSWQTAYFSMSLFTVFVMLLVWKLLPQQQYFKPQTLSFSHYNRIIISQFRQKKLWFAMLIGGVNFAIFVNLYSVIGFRLSAEPYSLSPGFVSLIFLCYLTGTASSFLSGRWVKRGPISGMLVGTAISFVGALLTYFPFVITMVFGLLLISFGAFFLHALAYSWVSRHATQAKATATSLYLVHYYIGGSLGGFLLLYLWQHFQWNGVLAGAAGFYLLLVYLIRKLSDADKQAPLP